MREISHISIALVLRYSMGSNGGQRPIFRSWLRKRVYDMDTSHEASMMQAHRKKHDTGVGGVWEKQYTIGVRGRG